MLYNYSVGAFAERSIFMTAKEKLNLLQGAIAQLTELFRELNDELPKLEFVGAGAPANSEVKKMPIAR